MVISVADAIAAYRQTGDQAILEKIKKPGETGEGGSFGAMLKGFATDSLETVKAGENMALAGVAGKANIQEVILAVNQASLALETVSTLRDKVITAYKEIMQMPI